MNSAYSIPLDADRLCFQGISFNAAKELSVFQLTLKFEPTCQEGRRASLRCIARFLQFASVLISSTIFTPSSNGFIFRCKESCTRNIKMSLSYATRTCVFVEFASNSEAVLQCSKSWILRPSEQGCLLRIACHRMGASSMPVSDLISHRRRWTTRKDGVRACELGSAPLIGASVATADATTHALFEIISTWESE